MAPLLAPSPYNRRRLLTGPLTDTTVPLEHLPAAPAPPVLITFLLNPVYFINQLLYLPQEI